MDNQELTKSLTLALKNAFGNDDAAVLIKRVPLICQDIKGIHETMREMKELMEQRFITKDVFWPVKVLVYSATGMILAGVITAFLSLILRK